jgi:hypothetical protein
MKYHKLFYYQGRPVCLPWLNDNTLIKCIKANIDDINYFV